MLITQPINVSSPVLLTQITMLIPMCVSSTAPLLATSLIPTSDCVWLDALMSRGITSTVTPGRAGVPRTVPWAPGAIIPRICVFQPVLLVHLRTIHQGSVWLTVPKIRASMLIHCFMCVPQLAQEDTSAVRSTRPASTSVIWVIMETHRPLCALTSAQSRSTPTARM